MRRPLRSMAVALIGAALLLAPTALATAAEPATGNIVSVSIMVGEDETSRNFAWFSDSAAPEVVMFAPSASMNGTAFPAGATVVQQSRSGPVASKPGYAYHHATIAGLEPNTDYTYQLGREGAWSRNYTFRTGSGVGDFQFIFVGDPQLGTSGDLDTETVQWQASLDVAWAMYPDAQFLLSAGDQIDRVPIARDEEYTAFKSPEQLTRYPLATTLGNHDLDPLAYDQHFNPPNHLGSSALVDGNYHYTYNDTLFIHLNANTLAHYRLVEYTRGVMEANPAKWTIVTFHHSIYSVAPHATDPDAEDFTVIEGRRTALSRGMSDIGVDLVLMGHDHYYTRTPLMNRGTTVDGPDGDVTTGPGFLVPATGDVLYITGNSPTGSKYYGRNEALPEPAPWSEVENQENVANFSRVRVGACSIIVSTHRSNDRTLVDQVELSGDTAAPTLTVPANATLAGGDDFDPMTGVSADDDCGPAEVTVAGTVDRDTPGEYLLTYVATDRTGHTATATRTITVPEAPTPAPTVTPSATASPTAEPTSSPPSAPAASPSTRTPGLSTDPSPAGTPRSSDPKGSAPGGSRDELAATGAPVGAAILLGALAAIGAGATLVLRRGRG